MSRALPPTLSQAKSRGVPSARGRFLRINDVIATTGLSRTTIYRLIETDEFPRQHQLTKRSIGWWEAEVEGWLESRHRSAA